MQQKRPLSNGTQCIHFLKGLLPSWVGPFKWITTFPWLQTETNEREEIRNSRPCKTTLNPPSKKITLENSTKKQVDKFHKKNGVDKHRQFFSFFKETKKKDWWSALQIGPALNSLSHHLQKCVAGQEEGLLSSWRCLHIFVCVFCKQKRRRCVAQTRAMQSLVFQQENKQQNHTEFQFACPISHCIENKTPCCHVVETCEKSSFTFDIPEYYCLPVCHTSLP